MMKKYFLMMVMLFTVSVYSFAEGNETNEAKRVEQYDIKVNMNKLSSYLNLSKDQEDAVSNIEDNLSKDLMFAAVECSDVSRGKVVVNALNKNMQHMSYVLNKEQYHKYLTVLNMTMINRNILK